MKKLTREFYIPKDYIEFKPELGDYPKDMFACYVSREKPYAIFFIGKQSKPVWHLSFKDNFAMKDKILSQIKSLMSWQEKKNQRKIEKKNKYEEEIANMKVGDLYYSSWGYDQTNVDFYQVIAINGKSFTLKEIASKTVDGSTYSHGMADERVPVKDAFLDKPEITKRTFKLNSYSWIRPTTETEKHYCSWYA
jgi:hypothetical protein